MLLLLLLLVVVVVLGGAWLPGSPCMNMEALPQQQRLHTTTCSTSSSLLVRRHTWQRLGQPQGLLLQMALGMAGEHRATCTFPHNSSALLQEQG